MKYERILLIVPPFYRLLGSRNNWMHLGLHYIGAMLAKHGYQVKIYNADADLTTEETDYKTFFKRDIKESLSDSPIWTEISQILEKENPDLIGITITSITKNMGYKIAEIAKQTNPTVPVVMGGPHSTLKPCEPLLNRNIDYSIRGEGEYTFLRLVQGEDVSRINGLVWRRENEIQVNPPSGFIENLDALPSPIFELELMPVNPKESFFVVQAARGCPFNCFFCSSPKLWGSRVRRRSINNVIAEIKHKKERYDISYLYFSDDTFNTNSAYLRGLCREIIRQKLNISFSCEARLNLIDKVSLRLMKKAGCVRVKVGMESGNDRVLRLMRKGITVKETRKAMRKIKEVGIPVTVYAMIGVPTETTSEMLDTLSLCRTLDPDWVSLSVATPWYGTEMYDMVANQLEINPEEPFLFHQSGSMINNNVTQDIISQFLELNNGKRREPE